MYIQFCMLTCMVQNTSDIIYSVDKYCQVEMFLNKIPTV